MTAQTWDTDELRNDFEAEGFVAAPRPTDGAT
jgi:hypothetical protein